MNFFKSLALVAFRWERIIEQDTKVLSSMKKRK